jgi:hypothetical protein
MLERAFPTPLGVPSLFYVPWIVDSLKLFLKSALDVS